MMDELRDRRVFRVAIAYAAVAWLVIEVLSVISDTYALPPAVLQVVIYIAAAGFAVALSLAWAFDVKPARPNTSQHDSTGVLPGPRSWPGIFSRPSFLLGTGLLVLIAGLGAARWWLQSSDAPVAVDATRLAILPFDVRGAPDLQYLREGVVDLLSAKLNGAGDLTTVDPNALITVIDEGERISVTRAREIAQRFGAQAFITGSVLEAGGQIEIRAALYDESGDEENATSVRTNEEELLDALDRLARTLIAKRFRSVSGEFKRLAALTTNSTPALKAFLTGEAAFRKGDLDGAVRRFETAVTEDTTFALAHYRLSVAESWRPRSSRDVTTVREARAAAQKYAERLSESLRAVLEAYVMYQGGGSNTEAEGLLRSLLRRQPDHAEAWFMLGESLLHGANARGRSRSEAKEAFERASTLDAMQPYVLLHLADLAAEEGDLGRLDSLRSRLADVAPDQARIVESYKLMLQAETGNTDSLDAHLETLPPDLLVESLWRGGATTRSEVGIRRIANALARRGSEAQRTYATLVEASLAAGAGQPTAMLASLANLGDLREELEPAGDLVSAVDRWPVLLAIPFLPLAETDVQAARGSLAPLAEADASDAYLHGILSLRLGDFDTLRMAKARLEELEADHLSMALDAHVARRRGDPEKALRILVQTGDEFGIFERYLLGELNAELGRPVEAIRWFSSFPEYGSSTMVGIAMYPYAELRLAEQYEEVGDLDRARVHYATFLSWWDEPEATMVDVAEGARERLRRIVAR